MVMNFVVRLLNTLYLLDEPGDGSGGGGNGDGNPGAANNGATELGADGKPVVKQEPVVKKEPVVDNSRERGILADLEKERKARQKYEREANEHRVALETERKRIQALVGLTPKSAEETDEELIRARINKMYPALGDLTADELKEFRAMKKELADLKAGTKSQWTTQGQKALNTVSDAVKTALGGADLTPRQKQRVQQAYVAFIESDPTIADRYEAGDPKVTDEFVESWMEDFVKPGERRALAAQPQRQRVPNGNGRTIVGAGEKKIDVTNDAQVEDFLVAGFRNKGGQFGK